MKKNIYFINDNVVPANSFFFYNFCSKMETVDFLFPKNPPNMPKCPNNYRVNNKSALKTSDFNFFLYFACVHLISHIWIKFVKNDFVYFEFEILKFLALVSTKT